MNLVQTPSQPEADANLPNPSRPRRGRGLVQEVVDDLSSRIREGSIAAGSKLPTESEIMARYAVSRTVVREAISHMQANRLVETRHGVGTFALAAQNTSNFRLADVDFATLSDVIALLELRVSLETEAAGLAAQRRTDAHLEAMQQQLHAFQDAITSEGDTVPSDFGFHMEIARATGNRHFADLMTYLGTMVIPRTRVNTVTSAPEGRTNYLRRVHADHEYIFNAIRNQDTDAARAAMRTHLSNSRDRLKNAQNQVN